VARLAGRQRLLAKWYQAIALAPFTLVFVVLKLFGDSTNRFWDVLVGATLLWASALARVHVLGVLLLKMPPVGLAVRLRH